MRPCPELRQELHWFEVSVHLSESLTDAFKMYVLGFWEKRCYLTGRKHLVPFNAYCKTFKYSDNSIKLQMPFLC